MADFGGEACDATQDLFDGAGLGIYEIQISGKCRSGFSFHCYGIILRPIYRYLAQREIEYLHLSRSVEFGDIAF